MRKAYSLSSAPEPEKREIVDGKIRSYFTGEWIDADIGTKRPLAVMLSMTPAALPMSGPTGASVIYECPVEKRITRWMFPQPAAKHTAKIIHRKKSILFFINIFLP